jgi:hypothetical protein
LAAGGNLLPKACFLYFFHAVAAVRFFMFLGTSLFISLGAKVVVKGMLDKP